METIPLREVSCQRPICMATSTTNNPSSWIYQRNKRTVCSCPDSNALCFPSNVWLPEWVKESNGRLHRRCLRSQAHLVLFEWKQWYRNHLEWWYRLFLSFDWLDTFIDPRLTIYSPLPIYRCIMEQKDIDCIFLFLMSISSGQREICHWGPRYMEQNDLIKRPMARVFPPPFPEWLVLMSRDTICITFTRMETTVSLTTRAVLLAKMAWLRRKNQYERSPASSRVECATKTSHSRDYFYLCRQQALYIQWYLQAGEHSTALHQWNYR